MSEPKSDKKKKKTRTKRKNNFQDSLNEKPKKRLELQTDLNHNFENPRQQNMTGEDSHKLQGIMSEASGVISEFDSTDNHNAIQTG